MTDSRPKRKNDKKRRPEEKMGKSSNEENSARQRWYGLVRECGEVIGKGGIPRQGGGEVLGKEKGTSQEANLYRKGQKKGSGSHEKTRARECKLDQRNRLRTGKVLGHAQKQTRMAKKTCL